MILLLKKITVKQCDRTAGSGTQKIKHNTDSFPNKVYYGWQNNVQFLKLFDSLSVGPMFHDTRKTVCVYRA